MRAWRTTKHENRPLSQKRYYEYKELVPIFRAGSKAKTISPMADNFLAVEPVPLSRIVLAFRFVNSGRYKQWRSFCGFLYYPRTEHHAPVHSSPRKRIR
jgi:hypothetical protein